MNESNLKQTIDHALFHQRIFNQNFLYAYTVELKIIYSQTNRDNTQIRWRRSYSETEME